MKLYDVAIEGQAIERLLEASQGELTPELEERLDALMLGGKEKIEAAAFVRSNLKADAKACRDEAARLDSRADAYETQAKRLEERMLVAVDAAFGGKVATPMFTIWGQNTGASVSFDVAPDADLQKVDPRFVRTTYALDKRLLLEAHKAGAAMPSGVTAIPVPPTRYLRVR